LTLFYSYPDSSSGGYLEIWARICGWYPLTGKMILSVFCRKWLIRQFYWFYLHNNQDWVSCLLLWCDAVRKQNVELFRFDGRRVEIWKCLRKVFVKHRETKLIFITYLNYFVSEHVFHKPVRFKHCSTPIAKPATTGWATGQLPIDIFKIIFHCLVQQQVATIPENSATSYNHFDPGKYQLVATLPIAYTSVSPVWTQNISLGVLNLSARSNNPVTLSIEETIIDTILSSWLWKKTVNSMWEPNRITYVQDAGTKTKCSDSSVRWGDKVKYLGLLRWFCSTNIDYFDWKMRKEVITACKFTLSQANNGLLFVSIERMTIDYVGQSTFYPSVGVLEV